MGEECLMSVYRLDKESLDKRNYQIILSGEQIGRLLKTIEDEDIVTVHDVEEILQEAVARDGSET
jgi:hypothetical protein